MVGCIRFEDYSPSGCCLLLLADPEPAGGAGVCVSVIPTDCEAEICVFEVVEEDRAIVSADKRLAGLVVAGCEAVILPHPPSLRPVGVSIGTERGVPAV